MEIKTLKDIDILLSSKDPQLIDAVDCEVSLFNIANNTRLIACERIIDALNAVSALEQNYCRLYPERNTKLNPHTAISVIIRANNPPTDFPDYETAMNNLYFSLEKLTKIANNYSIWLLIENPKEKLLLSPLELRDLIDQLSSPWIGVYFNKSNISEYYEYDFSKILGKRIIKTV